MVLYGFLKISQAMISVAKITVRYSFPCSVSRFFRNFEVSFMVLYGFLKIYQALISAAKITVRSSLSYLPLLSKF